MDAAGYLREHADEHLQRYLALLRIPSQSALPERRPDMAAAADWVARALSAAGCPEVEVAPTGGHPAVLGAWRVDPAKPTVLMYSHYDVQPADPLELWATPPFDPSVRDGRVYARGAADDKAGVWSVLAALEAVARTAGQPPCNLKFIFEGEEEIGSPSLPALLAERRRQLACDVMISADGAMYAPDSPSLTLAHRGIAGCQIDVAGAASDLHSGAHGGAVVNPLHALAAIVASLHEGMGRVAVPGFYDRVRPLTDAERADIAALPFDEAAYARELGVAALDGEPGYTTAERRTARPTLEINGMWGGFQGDGSKTVLPALAHAKITCRLVPDQTPAAVLDAIEAHVRRVAPPGVRASVRRMPGSALPYAMPRDLPAVAVAAEVLREVCGVAPLYVRSGGTLPITELVRDALGAYTISLAFGQEDENPHAPNEFYRLADLERGTLVLCRFWERYGAGG